MEKGFFHQSVGYWQTNSEPGEEILAAYPDGTVEVPLRSSNLHRWMGGGWVEPDPSELAAHLGSEIRAERDYRLLRQVDPVVTNPLRWGELTEEQRAAWADYRRALLDIPEQPGFPFEITWPSPPQ